MIHDIIERFTYLFHLWCRERKQDAYWPFGRRPAHFDRPAVWQDPKYEILWTESTPSFIVREVSLYVGVLLLISNICFLIDKFFVSARHAVGVTFLWLIGLWTLLSVLMVIDMRKKRKAYRLKHPESSNQPLQLTAERRDDPVTFHEPPYRPSFPPFRQR
jgi:hypothetical protein